VRFKRAEQMQQITTWGRYVDEWSHRNGRWGIDKRLASRDFDELRDVGTVSHLDRGGRDRSDPYAVLHRTL